MFASLPAIFQSAHQPVNIDMFDSASQEQEEQRQSIMQHALAVIQHFQNMNVSAVQMCIHLFLCREEFKNSGETGWERFCAANFEQYGLSHSNIRRAVRTGRSIVSISKKLKNSNEEMPDLDSISRSALFIFGDAPPDVQERLIIEMNAITESNENKGPTAEEMRRLVDELKTEMVAKEKLLAIKDDTLHRLTKGLNAREEEAIQARELIAKLEKKISTPVEHVVHKLPPGIKDEMEMKEKLSEEISFRKDELSRIESEVNRLKMDKAKYQTEMAAKRQAKEVLEEINADIQNMMVKYADALMQKLSNSDPEYVTPLLESAAQRLRVLANQLSPSLI